VDYILDHNFKIHGFFKALVTIMEIYSSNRNKVERILCIIIHYIDAVHTYSNDDVVHIDIEKFLSVGFVKALGKVYNSLGRFDKIVR
jgi:hypothetical protein